MSLFSSLFSELKIIIVFHNNDKNSISSLGKSIHIENDLKNLLLTNLFYRFVFF